MPTTSRTCHEHSEFKIGRSGTRPVPGQSPVLTRAACGRVPTGSYSSAGQLSVPWRVPGGIPTGSSRVFEQVAELLGSEVKASLRRFSPNGARSVFNSELKSIRRPRGAKNRPSAVGKPAGLRPGYYNSASISVRLFASSPTARTSNSLQSTYLESCEQVPSYSHLGVTAHQRLSVGQITSKRLYSKLRLNKCEVVCVKSDRKNV
ncbi:Coiled-coil domain-containing protein 71 [Branchiostoma belcheri]|nr:Coiled-coil domain-containing protein 71 [Branchiostoma belcheri]